MLSEKAIPKSKIRLHSVRCQRNTVKCEKCGKNVDKGMLEEHHEEMHSVQRCKHCGFEAEKREFGSHEASCLQRPVECDFCEQTIAFDKFAVHQESCGNKTRKCTTCTNFIKIKGTSLFDYQTGKHTTPSATAHTLSQSQSLSQETTTVCLATKTRRRISSSLLTLSLPSRISHSLGILEKRIRLPLRSQGIVSHPGNQSGSILDKCLQQWPPLARSLATPHPTRHRPPPQPPVPFLLAVVSRIGGLRWQPLRNQSGKPPLGLPLSRVY